ncbi:alkaline shock response membrane anchor protein AmaP [Actinomadura macra]|uniref:alkaline shock response membrane anchor protein AmaP n=1 Tax=Actinomadura macra TaxID=46164 RepID=UPI000831AA7F|nr:alkaline shock response membrane anchor protein AmaP [Actinomadura macra]
MDRRPAHLNRTGLILLGLLLAIPGAAALARGLGAFGDGRASSPVLSTRVHDYVNDQSWFWPAVAVASVVLALLGLAWLLAQGRSSRLPALTLEPKGGDGTTHLPAKAVTDALEAEIEEYPGVRSARARLLGTSRNPKLRLNVAYSRRADLSELRQRIADEALRRLCLALEREEVPAVVRLRLVSDA